MKKLSILLLLLLTIVSTSYAQKRFRQIDNTNCEKIFTEIIDENQNLPEFRRHTSSKIECIAFFKDQMGSKSRYSINYEKVCTKYISSICEDLLTYSQRTDVMANKYGTGNTKTQNYVAGLMGIGATQLPKLFAKQPEGDEEIVASSTVMTQSGINKGACENGPFPPGTLKQKWNEELTGLAAWDTKRCEAVECDTKGYFILNNKRCVCNKSKGFTLNSSTNQCVCASSDYEIKNGQCVKKPEPKPAATSSSSPSSSDKTKSEQQNVSSQQGKKITKEDCDKLGADYEWDGQSCIHKSSQAYSHLTPNEASCQACGYLYDDESKDCIVMAVNSEAGKLYLAKIPFSNGHFYCNDKHGILNPNDCGVIFAHGQSLSYYSSIGNIWTQISNPSIGQFKYIFFKGKIGNKKIMLPTRLDNCKTGNYRISDQ